MCPSSWLSFDGSMIVSFDIKTTKHLYLYVVNLGPTKLQACVAVSNFERTEPVGLYPHLVFQIRFPLLTDILTCEAVTTPRSSSLDVSIYSDVDPGEPEWNPTTCRLKLFLVRRRLPTSKSWGRLYLHVPGLLEPYRPTYDAVYKKYTRIGLTAV